MAVDVDIAPSLVGQVWLAALVVRVFGFSHVILRLLTMTAAGALLWIVDRILRLAGAALSIRVLATSLLVANPIVLHLTFSFMTEMYGYALAFLGALVWFNGRSSRAGDDPRLASWAAGFTAATLIGASFWVRQFCVALFPALLLASLWHVRARHGRRAMLDNLPAVAAWSAWFAAVVAMYFAWATITDHYPSAFSEPLASLLYPRASLALVSAYEVAAYLTAFLFPFLLLERWRATRWRRFLLVAAVLVAAIVGARIAQASHQSFHHHAHFPFSANVVYDTGVGPITLTTTYWDARSPRPRWPRDVWSAIEWLALAGMVLWARGGAGATGAARLTPLAAEIRTFGVLVATIGLAICVQAYEWLVLDRYYLPCLLGAVIALGARAGRPALSEVEGPSSTRAWAALAAVLPIAWFSIAGVHDYFRWNDARWEAVRLAAADGATPQTLDGGFEVNGWLNYDAAKSRAQPAGCRGACACRPDAFYCTDDSYMVSMEAPAGRTVIARLPVDWWIAEGPDVILSRR